MYLLVFRCVEPTLVRNPNVFGVGGKLDDLCIAVWVSVMIMSQHPDNRETGYSNVLVLMLVLTLVLMLQLTLILIYEDEDTL